MPKIDETDGSRMRKDMKDMVNELHDDNIEIFGEHKTREEIKIKGQNGRNTKLQEGDLSDDRIRDPAENDSTYCAQSAVNHTGQDAAACDVTEMTEGH